MCRFDRLNPKISVAACAVAIALGGAGPAVAQSQGAARQPTLEELQKGLQERDALIRQLLHRVEVLERRMPAAPASGRTAAAVPQASPPEVKAKLDGSATGQQAQRAAPRAQAAQNPPQREQAQPGPGAFVVDKEAAERALERALVQTGALLLPPGTAEFVPSVAYTRRESSTPGQVALLTSTNSLVATEDVSRSNQVEGAATLRLGLPWTSQLEIGVPYDYKGDSTTVRALGAGISTQTSDAYGLGDPTITLTKQIAHEAEWRPNLFWSVGWDSNFGQTKRGISLGTGFNELRTSVLATKRQDPLVFTSGFQYAKSLEHNNVEPGDQYTPSIGMLFAVSPETSLRVASQLTFANSTKQNGADIPGSNQLVGVFEFGVLSILGPGLVLDLTADAGLTPDAPDFSFKVSFPIRFSTGW